MEHPSRFHSPFGGTSARWLLGLCCLVGLPAAAATVEQVGVADMARESELIFHGTVESRRVERLGPEDIVTRVTFRIDEVIKGSVEGGAVELEFSGGTHDGVTLSISDMVVPSVGEEGVYFVERPGRRQVNPLFGWSQGHFLVRHDNGGRIVTTHDLEPVVALRAQSVVPGASLSDGRAKGVITSTDDGLQPVSLEQFKADLRRIVEDSR